MPFSRELKANIRKEWISETRASHGLMSALAFGFSSAVTFNLATLNQSLNPPVVAAIIIVLLIFSGLLSVPRAFIAEDEGRTFELLTLTSSAEGAFLGKALVHGLLQLFSALIVTTVFVVVSKTPIHNPWAFAGFTALLCLCITGNLSLAASLVVGAQNRWVLAAVLSLPLLVPTVFFAHPLLQWALEPISNVVWNRFLIGLSGLTAVAWTLGPTLTAEAWKHSGRSG